MIIEVTTVAFFLEKLNLVIKLATVVSNILIPDVIAAKNIRIKNKLPNMAGHGNCEKISGKEINIKLGPALGATPKENTIGKIIMPDNKAIRVSQIIKIYDDF